ncbi:hypothetical protein FHS83_001221 [Rhizomicrobium palustre]|uniref:Uncharacterized protein n=1 Tax=Rhizomicrobium palustre TaxID=189966 RepID=A0A846MX48_9PROT|nr:hypothetical protein [Rhizomicrobium palustre]NIK87903.1 hypothetical protein [Rhizomicrobium palustre]
MFWNIYSVSLTILAAVALYWLGPKVIAAFRRFDDENRARIENERADRRDAAAHIRHTLGVASEQVEDILEVAESDPRTGMMVTRYIFEGVRYGSRAEAENIRAQKIGDIARGFYRELPAALAARRSGERLG